VQRICSPNAQEHSEHALTRIVTVLAHVDIFQASRPVALVKDAAARHSHALMSQLTQTPTETVQVTATNAMALEPAEQIILFVLERLLHAAVPVPGLLTVVRLVLILLVLVGMQPVAAILVGILLMALGRIAERFASPATAQEAA
jgi:hypothetical protein